MLRGVSATPREAAALSWKTLLRGVCYTVLVRLLDGAGRLGPRPTAGALAEPLARLRHDGFVNLGPLFGTVDAVACEIKALLGAGEPRLSGVSRFYLRHPFLAAPAMAEYLHDAPLQHIVRAYLGRAAAFDRLVAWRIPEAASVRKNPALWHHDWCGHRLKLFVLLHDVTPAGRPTRYAVGSHSGAWRWMSYPLSRYADAWVERRFPIAQLTGRKGDCILLDTNGLHRATGEAGYAARDILCFEFSDGRKSRWLAPRDFEIGTRRDLLRPDFDARDTLVDPTRLTRGAAGHLVHGTIDQLADLPHVDAATHPGGQPNTRIAEVDEQMTSVP